MSLQINDIDENKIVEMYSEDNYTLRHIADIYKTNHHRIKRILDKHGIPTTARKTRKKRSDESKRKMSETCKEMHRTGKIKVWSVGKKMTRDHCLKNMRAHLKFNVSLDWLNSFTDIEKLKFLNKRLSRKRDSTGFDVDMYIKFIEKFYHDETFNTLYKKWVDTGDKWIKPSLDHIDPKSRGGALSLDNLQFISWLENRAKVDMTQQEWNKIKENIHYYL